MGMGPGARDIRSLQSSSSKGSWLMFPMFFASLGGLSDSIRVEPEDADLLLLPSPPSRVKVMSAGLIESSHC